MSIQTLQWTGTASGVPVDSKSVGAAPAIERWSVMCPPPNSFFARDAVASLRRLGRIRRLNAYLFIAAMVCVPLGIVGLMLNARGFEWLVTLGFAFAGLLVLQSFVVYPFLRCPICGHRFFQPDGAWFLVSKIDPFKDTCLHCGTRAGT